MFSYRAGRILGLADVPFQAREYPYPSAVNPQPAKFRLIRAFPQDGGANGPVGLGAAGSCRLITGGDTGGPTGGGPHSGGGALETQ
jgi:hypothetical protein